MSVAAIPVRHLERIFAQDRTMVHVLAELMMAEDRLGTLRLRARVRDLTDAEDLDWTRLERTIDRCKDEAKAMVERDTGISWDALESALS